MRRRVPFALLAVFCLVLLALAGWSQFAGHAEVANSAGPPLQYMGSWGVKGAGPGQLDEPVDITTDSIGDVYITDIGSKFVHKFGPLGKPLLSFQEDGLKHPQSIAVDSGGAIYVSDPIRSSIFICLPSGERDRHYELRVKSRAKKENVLGVRVADDGLIYVLDANAGKITAFTNRFRTALTWQAAEDSGGGSHELAGAIAIGPDTSVYVADPDRSRILRYTRDGHYLSEIGSSATARGLKLSSQFAVNAGYVFAMDADGRMLHAWTTDGMPKLDADLAPELGQAYRPAPPIAVSPRGELLVLDESAARVLRYRINF
jgi:DNA-binding beta-propeller fold protein YncE